MRNGITAISTEGVSFVANCHNVAVVATAPKLAVIAWRILSASEPYHYAQSAATATKLASLRIAVTGEKRRSGNPKGQKCEAKLPGGSRSIRSLDDVYKTKAYRFHRLFRGGERRHLNETGTLRLAERNNASQLIS